MATQGFHSFTAVASIAASLLGACAPMPAPRAPAVASTAAVAETPAGDVLVPNANLVVQGTDSLDWSVEQVLTSLRKLQPGK